MKNKLIGFTLLFTILIAGCIIPRNARAAQCITDDGAQVTITCPLHVAAGVGVITPPPGTVACVGYSYTTGPCQSNHTALVTSSTGIPSGCVGGAIPASVQACDYTPPPVDVSAYTPLIFNAGSQSRYDGLYPGVSHYYMFTVPAGQTTFSMSISTMSQNSDLNITIMQVTSVPQTSVLDRALTDALTYYNSDIGLWGIPWFKAYAEGSAWAKIGNNFDGEAIYLKASTASPAKNQAGFAASIPGTYYAVVKNVSDSAAANYAVYVKQ